jgi:NADPH-dependent curcumin reductase CurA
VLVRNLYLSVEPAMRAWVSAVKNYSEPVPIGGVMRSFAVARVEASRHPDYRVGDLVTGLFGWQDYAAVETQAIQRKVADTDLPPSTALGVLGLNGVTAHYGLLEVGRPRPGETVVVSSTTKLQISRSGSPPSARVAWTSTSTIPPALSAMRSTTI